MGAVIKPVRVNIIMVKNMNEELYDIISNNANALFARVEGIMNVAVSLADEKVYIPAHFGMNGSANYRRLFYVMERLFT